MSSRPVRPSLPAAMQLWRCLAALRAVPPSPRRLSAAAPRTRTEADGAGPRGDGDGALRPLYLDVQATTPLDPRVLDRMLPYLTGCYGNPHSRTHAYGWESEAATERARRVSAGRAGREGRGALREGAAVAEPGGGGGRRR